MEWTPYSYPAHAPYSPITPPRTPDNTFATPVAIALDSANNRALVVDGQSVIAVDLDPYRRPRERTILSDNTTPDANNPFSTPVAVAVDTTGNRALVVDGQAVVAVDLTTGVRTILSDNTTPDANNTFFTPVAVAVDSDRQPGASGG